MDDHERKLEVAHLTLCMVGGVILNLIRLTYIFMEDTTPILGVVNFICSLLDQALPGTHSESQLNWIKQHKGELSLFFYLHTIILAIIHRRRKEALTGGASINNCARSARENFGDTPP